MSHIFGAQHSYAEAPLGYWLMEAFELERNPYDRVVHFSFGLLLAYPLRDYFMNKFKWPTWVCWVLPAEITSLGSDYLGTQGDPWDAQKDMAMAFCGAILGLILAAIGRQFAGRMTNNKELSWS